MPYGSASLKEHNSSCHSRRVSWALVHSQMHGLMHQWLILHPPDSQHGLATPGQCLISAGWPLICSQALFSYLVSGAEALLSPFLGCRWVSFQRSWSFGPQLPSWAWDESKVWIIWCNFLIWCYVSITQPYVWVMIVKSVYGLWPMGYRYKIPANQLGRSKNVWPMREYGLYLVCVRRESTVIGTIVIMNLTYLMTTKLTRTKTKRMTIKYMPLIVHRVTDS